MASAHTAGHMNARLLFLIGALTASSVARADSLRADSSREQSARAESACIGWAVPGALGGAMVGSLSTMGAFAIAGSDINNPVHQTRNLSILGGAIGIGATLGPVVSCRAAGATGGAVPTASFLVGGGVIGGAALGVGWFAFADWLESRRSAPTSDPQRFSRSEGAAGLGAILIMAGAVAGGYAGYRLHGAVFSRSRGVALTPVATRDFRGLVVSF